MFIDIFLSSIYIYLIIISLIFVIHYCYLLYEIYQENNLNYLNDDNKNDINNDHYYLPNSYYKIINNNPSKDDIIEAMNILDENSEKMSSNQYIHYSNYLRRIYMKI
jgi:hypothetical protein